MSGVLAMILSSRADVTPAPVNWADINASGQFAASGSNADQTISGIDVPITLRFEDSNAFALGLMFYIKNGGSDVPFFGGANTVSMASGNTLHFTITATVTMSGTLSVYNDSAGGVLLDTFDYFLLVTA